MPPQITSQARRTTLCVRAGDFRRSPLYLPSSCEKNYMPRQTPTPKKMRFTMLHLGDRFTPCEVRKSSGALSLGIDGWGSPYFDALCRSMDNLATPTPRYSLLEYRRYTTKILWGETPSQLISVGTHYPPSPSKEHNPRSSLGWERRESVDTKSTQSCMSE